MESRQRSPCIELILEGERFCRLGEYGSGVRCFEQAVNHGTDDLNTLSVIYSQLGNAYTCLGDLGKAVEYYQHDKTLTKSIGDLVGEAKACGSLCNTLKLLGKHEEAILISQRHLEIARELCIKATEAQALYNMGNVYHVKAKHRCQPATSGLGQQDAAIQSDLKIALLCYNQHLSIVRELGDRTQEGRVCGSIGNTHYLLGNCEEAIISHTERLAIAKEFGDKEAQRRAYTNIGNCYIILGEYEQATQVYLQTLSISRQLGDRAFEAQACYNLGSTYTLLTDFQRAIEYHLRHKHLADELNDRLGMARACWLLSNAYASLGNFTKAVEYTQQQLLISTEIGDEPGILTAQRCLQDYTARSSGEQEKPRVRRKSMEDMQLLSLTPEQAASASKVQTSRRGTETTRKLFDNSGRRRARDGANAENGNANEHRRYNGVGDGPSRRLNSGSSSASPDKFFDLITRLQGRRMDDQRAEMKEEEVEEEEEEHPPRIEPLRNGLDQNGPEGEHEDPEESREKMNFMISMLARSQSKRLDEQRVCLNSLPGIRIGGGGEGEGPSQMARAARPANVGADRNNNEEIESNVFELDDNFFENLMRCQGTRLNDQRTAAPDIESFPTPTIPDEDFISLIVRMQSSRIEDQRCRFQPDGNP